MSDSDLRKTIIELERSLDRERALQDAIRRVALRALAVVSAKVPALEGAVRDLTRAIESDPGDTAWLDRLSGQLADAVRSSDQREDLADGILAVVQRGLHGFEFLDPELEALTRAADRRDKAEIERTLARLFSVMHDKCEQAMTEREELTEVVGEIWHRLGDVDTALSEDEARGQRARESVSDLHAGISGDVEHIKGRVVDVEDLATLRTEVTRGLDRMVERVTTFRDEQEDELQVALERNRVLRSKGRSLEGQVQALRDRLEQARAEATRDSLTGLPNRMAFEQRLEQLPAELEKSGGASLLVWDIDHFKTINDEYGHTAGDKVLRAVAEILAEGVREPDFVARYGGEEFVMIIHREPNAAYSQANTIRDAVDRLIVRSGKTRLKVTISAGLAEIDPAAAPEAIFDAADHALLQAKKRGRDRIERAGD
ncbi:GGDEF domain-containing protein [Thioalkalivibrio sp. ALMg11]|uniref:GGDEF domain-containing protein n=1 Tax=Thioalkalivibrio sp. ALMg11 TaxID=1158165 RepID=UPI000365F97B|nr:GGDEF domain-containing protein [Thioalkalivibrio sp. ALMg11]